MSFLASQQIHTEKYENPFFADNLVESLTVPIYRKQKKTIYVKSTISWRNVMRIFGEEARLSNE